MNSECEGSYPFIWFYDQLCFYTVDQNCIRAVMFTCGYLTYDFFLITLFFKNKRSVDYQTIWHHIISGLGLMLACITGYAMPSIANVALCCELSTMFLNYRAMYSSEELNKPLPMVN